MIHLYSILIGSITGIITVIGQKYLPINFNFLANSGAIWLIPAFLFSFYLKVNKRTAVLISMLCLIFSVLGYYIFEAILNHHSFSFGGFMILWLVCAVIGGIIVGLGAYFSNYKDNYLKYFSINILPAVFLAEGLDKLIHINDYRHMIPSIVMQIVIGIVLYLIINKKDTFKRRNLISWIGLSIMGLIFYEVLVRITM